MIFTTGGSNDCVMCFNPLRMSDAYMCPYGKPALIQIMACRLIGTKPLLEPIVNWKLGNKVQCNLNKNWKLFIRENAFEYVIHEMGALLSQSQCVYTLRPRQNVRYFADDIFKRIFLNGNVWISINISLRLVPGGLIDNILALVQIMAWRLPGDKPLSEPMMVSLLMHICVTRPQWVNTILLTTCQIQMQNIHHILNSQNTPIAHPHTWAMWFLL